MEGIPYINRKGCGILYLSEITYIGQNYRRSDIHTLDGVTSIYVDPAELAPYVDERFNRSLDNMMINFDLVKSMSGETISFVNGDSLLVGYRNYLKVKKDYEKYLKNLQKPLAKQAYL